MSALETIRAQVPDHAKDIRLNLSSVLQPGVLSEPQLWGVALASAIAARHPPLTRAVLEEARARGVPAPVLEDAKAAAALMAMNNVYYRFRHMIGKETYSQKRAGLRMNRLAQPLSSKVDLELFSLAVSAINACELCLQAHEKVALEGGLTEDHVHDAVRIAATVHATAVSLEAAELEAA